MGFGKLNPKAGKGSAQVGQVTQAGGQSITQQWGSIYPNNIATSPASLSYGGTGNFLSGSGITSTGNTFGNIVLYPGKSTTPLILHNSTENTIIGDSGYNINAGSGNTLIGAQNNIQGSTLSNSTSLGYGSQTYQYGVAVGVSANAGGVGAVAIGYNAQAIGSSMMINCNSSTSAATAALNTIWLNAANSSSNSPQGTNTIVISANSAMPATSGGGNYAIMIGGNGTGWNALGGTSVGMGAAAQGNYSIGLGYGAVGSGTNAISLGYNSTCGSTSAVAIGDTSTANKSYASAIGYKAIADYIGQTVFSSGAFASAGDITNGKQTLWTVTTDGTTSVLMGSGGVATAPTNYPLAVVNGTYLITGDLFAKNAGGSELYSWSINTIVNVGASLSTITYSSPSGYSGGVLASVGTYTGTPPTINVNTSTGAFTIAVIGQASTTLRWAANLRITKITF